jgi:hypothetical protein
VLVDRQPRITLLARFLGRVRRSCVGQAARRLGFEFGASGSLAWCPYRSRPLPEKWIRLRQRVLQGERGCFTTTSSEPARVGLFSLSPARCG